jgi:multidrug efflux pump subunit AcrA (membrane-fusion protein)
MSGFARIGRWSVLALVALVLLAAPGCDEVSSEEGQAEGDESAQPAGAGDGQTADDNKEEEKKPKKKTKERTTSVSAAPVIRGDLVVPVVAEGSIRARNATEIKFEIGGRIDKLWVREGQRVHRGQELAGLDDREYQLALEEANARYLQGLGQLAVEEEGYDSRKAERTLTERRGELAQLESDGTITREERLDRELQAGMDAVREGAYRRELLEVRSGVAAARADATRAKLDIEPDAVPPGRRREHRGGGRSARVRPRRGAGRTQGIPDDSCAGR